MLVSSWFLVIKNQVTWSHGWVLSLFPFPMSCHVSPIHSHTQVSVFFVSFRFSCLSSVLMSLGLSFPFISSLVISLGFSILFLPFYLRSCSSFVSVSIPISSLHPHCIRDVVSGEGCAGMHSFTSSWRVAPRPATSPLILCKPSVETE